MRDFRHFLGDFAEDEHRGSKRRRVQKVADGQSPSIENIKSLVFQRWGTIVGIHQKRAQKKQKGFFFKGDWGRHPKNRRTGEATFKRK